MKNRFYNEKCKTRGRLEEEERKTRAGENAIGNEIFADNMTLQNVVRLWKKDYNSYLSMVRDCKSRKEGKEERKREIFNVAVRHTLKSVVRGYGQRSISFWKDYG